MSDETRILACFTLARRKHEGLTPGQLARQLGIRTDQVKSAEAGRPCGTRAKVALLEWNELPCVAGQAGATSAGASPRTNGAADAATEKRKEASHD